MTEFVSIIGHGPVSFHDLFSDDDLLSEGSSVGNLSPVGCPGLQECTMADVQGRQLVPMEIEDTHTPPDPCTQALANAQAHGEDLSQRPRNSKPNARNVRAARSQAPDMSSRPSSQMPTTPRSLRGSGRTSLPQQCSCATCSSLQILNSRSSTATSECWWSVPPCRQKAPHHATCTWPPVQPGGGGRSSQQPKPSVHQQQGHPPQAGRDTSVAPHPDPTPASQRPLVRGRLGPNYDARSIIHSRQLACHDADVDWATVDVADTYQPKGEHEEAPHRRGDRPCDQDGNRSPNRDGPSPWAFGCCI
jgi:hypothetical protein